jgi:hypothetical protein
MTMIGRTTGTVEASTPREELQDCEVMLPDIIESKRTAAYLVSSTAQQ